MYAGQDFTAATPGECDVFGFDFARRLDVGDSVQSATWSAYVVQSDGTLTPDNSLIIGGAINIGTLTRQKAGPFDPAASYRLEASIMSAAGHGPLIFWARISSVPIT